MFLFKKQRGRYDIITVGGGFVENLSLLYLKTRFLPKNETDITRWWEG